ncbi:MAG: T9SS type A sorting domain-containing protein [Bacteroidota bacterium]
MSLKFVHTLVTKIDATAGRWIKKAGFCCIFYMLLISVSGTAQNREIWELQGSGNSSPFANQFVITQNNIVTAVGDDFFFIQTPEDRADNNDLTSNGIQVFTNVSPNVQVGDLVNVSGRIEEEEDMTRFNNNNLIVSVVGSNQSLPPIIELTPAFPSKNPDFVPELERVEGMLVSFSGFATGPSNSREQVPVTASNQRPFREPGIQFPGISMLPEWDGNPEGFWFDPNGVDQPENRFIAAGMDIEATGVMAQDEDFYFFLPTNYSTSGQGFLAPVRQKAADEITIGSINLLILVPDTENYTRKLRKLSKYIVESLGTPDILAVQELGNFTALISLRNFITQENPNAGYVAYYEDGPNNIKVGYLAKPSVVQNIEITQLGANEQLTIGGRVHDRPPLLIEGNLMTDPPTPIKVINVHMRSRIGVEGSDASFVRTKRHEQALSVAQMAQDRQDSDLFIVGDFNAFEFTDGYVDVLAQITGAASVGALFDLEDITDPELINHTANVQASERYSFIFEGDAQLIDHCVSTQLTGMEVVEVQFARGNADQPVAFEDNDQIVNRASDHDGFVVFVRPTNPLVNTTAPLTNAELTLLSANPLPKGQSIRIEVKEAGVYDLHVTTATGQIVHQQVVQLGLNEVVLPKQLASGTYIVQAKQDQRSRSWKLLIK